MNAHLPPDHPPVKPRKIGVLLLNLGTPDGTDYWSVRRYLKEFLSDPRVIETPKWLWWPILNLGILSFRPQKTGANYAKIWDKRTDESPLRVITRGQAEKLQDAMAADGVIVEYGMRYGNPSTESAIKKLHEQGCEKVLLFPLYPQYSATTTATANDQAFRALANIRWQPAVRTVPAYFEDLRRDAGKLDPRRRGKARLRARSGDYLVSRHAQILSGQGRSLSLPVLQDDTVGA